MNTKDQSKDNQEKSRRNGLWYNRVLVWVLSVMLGFLVFWLLGFIVQDLGEWPGPDYEQVEQQVLNSSELQRQGTLEEQLSQVKEDINAHREYQSSLRDSTDSAEVTMNRLLEIQRLALEKGRELTDAEQESLAEAKSLFLTNQKKYQQINEDLSKLMERRRELAGQLSDVKASLDKQREKAREQYQSMYRWHEVKTAAVKIAVLLPLLIGVVFGWWRWRHSLYVPLMYAVGIATVVKVGFVMHQHFPKRYFKYILIIVSIILVVWVLVYLLRKVAHPGSEWLLQQYREGYERYICPLCDFPIRRGPMKYLFWTRRSIKKLGKSCVPGYIESDEVPYTCPSCTTALFAVCDSCEKVRPLLMPGCPHCGNQLEVETIVANAGDELNN